MATWLMKQEMIDGKYHKKKFRGTDAELKVLTTWLATLKTDEAGKPKKVAAKAKEEATEAPAAATEAPAAATEATPAVPDSAKAPEGGK